MGKERLVTYERDGFIATVTLNRPEKRNALNMRVWEAVEEAITQAETDEGIRVVLLKGAGPSFSSGLELSLDNEIIKVFQQPPSAQQKLRAWRVIRRVQTIHNHLEAIHIPTIAVIQGHCLGGALEMVVCCDIRLCLKDALFSLPEPRLGIITDAGGLQRISLLVGEAKAREIAFRGHTFGANDALTMGLVNHVYDTAEELSQKAHEIAKEIGENAPLAVQGAKEVLNYHRREIIQRSLEYNAARSAMILPSEDSSEATNAFMEKRKAQFRGR